MVHSTLMLNIIFSFIIDLKFIDLKMKYKENTNSPPKKKNKNTPNPTRIKWSRRMIDEQHFILACGGGLLNSFFGCFLLYSFLFPERLFFMLKIF